MITRRYSFIDVTRGIAACLVMLQHSLYQSGLLGNWPVEKLSGFIPTSLELGETGVVAFFIVSGFVIPLSMEKTASMKLFWIHRALRIYPLYMLVFFLTLSIQSRAHVWQISNFLEALTTHVLFIQEYVVWYLGISCLAAIAWNKKPGLIVGLATLISVMADISCAVGVHLPMGRISMLLCCVAGLICYRVSQKDISTPGFTFLIGTLIVMIVINLFVGEEMYPSAHPTTTFHLASNSWALGIAIFVIPFLSRSSSIWNAKVLTLLGKTSYSIYLLHPLVLLLLSKTQLHGVWLILCTVIITVVCSALTYRFIESPPIKFGRRLALKTQGSFVPR
jgi:peptidoglycan/LPS O-acetylase OafA/YrhL